MPKVIDYCELDDKNIGNKGNMQEWFWSNGFVLVWDDPLGCMLSCQRYCIIFEINEMFIFLLHMFI